MAQDDPNPLRRPVANRLPLNIAHRGARAFAPENTLPAVEKAQSLGCEMVELDVQLSKDGVPVVHHDDQLTRCTDVRQRHPGRTSYFVSDFAWDELRQLDAGSWYVDQLSLRHDLRDTFLQSLTDAETDQFVHARERDFFASGEVHVPSLQQILNLVSSSKMLVNIELKNLPRLYPELATVVVNLVEAEGLEERVLISSFDHELLKVVRQRSRNIATGVLTHSRLACTPEYLKLLDADAYHPGCNGEFDSLGFGSISGELDSRGIAELRVCGYGVNVWVCNDKEQMRKLVAAGVTGIFSDFPNRVNDVLRELQS
ncbi:MAG: glycerophosphodiester phosphodiesterase [Planctomycetaceae bacterium]|nr:glycerophosphodiester phosphodiesterase [Planctomycetaceae bacterium]